MRFEFWLINGKDNIRLLLPVTPGSYEVDYANDIQTLNATEIGDINLKGNKKLSNINLEGFFTTNEYEFLKTGEYIATHPMDYVNLVKSWVDSSEPIRLIITSESVSRVNALYYVESIVYSEDNTSNGDINYRISLKEFRQMEIRHKVEATATNKANRAMASKPTAKTYTVVSGDNLTKIARKFYGDGAQWTRIYNANKAIIGKNTNLIFPGQVYIIP